MILQFCNFFKRRYPNSRPEFKKPLIMKNMQIHIHLQDYDGLWARLLGTLGLSCEVVCASCGRFPTLTRCGNRAAKVGPTHARCISVVSILAKRLADWAASTGAGRLGKFVARAGLLAILVREMARKNALYICAM